MNFLGFLWKNVAIICLYKDPTFKGLTFSFGVWKLCKPRRSYKTSGIKFWVQISEIVFYLYDSSRSVCKIKKSKPF